MSSINRHENGADEEEGIKVAIRMRPLNSKETGNARVWRVLSKYNSVTQTTSDGKPLPERTKGRSFFTFDKTFGEKSTTKELYDGVAQGIVESVVSGLNGTIFAYGQTSSGKTYTMQGSGTIEEGSSSEGGIVHMAAKDIFSNIRNDPDRVFLLRVSFVEIYNEEVRDLLVSSSSENVLKIREDPRRGVFVDATENIVTDFQSLLSVLFAGEKNRAFASTAMNERSSRSHTIFRITVESRMKGNQNKDEGLGQVDEDDDDASFTSVDGDDGAVRISTLNLVDLAGSESVRHTGATGERQKEGGMINQSLLTLSQVISKLGSSSSSHINFRDSKLTRLLQPSLSGNARMAVICCATPSELYLEETRSTLQFASRAKLVKTRAQINEVMDERSMIKKLQRELAEAKKATSADAGSMKQVQELESKATHAETAAMILQEKFERLTTSILRGGVNALINDRKRMAAKSSNSCEVAARFADLSSPSVLGADKKRRRQSDGIVAQLRHEESPLLDITNKSSALATFTPIIPRKVKTRPQLLENSSSFQLVLLKDALAAKSEITRSLNARLAEWQDKAEKYESSLEGATKEICDLKKAESSSEEAIQILSAEKEALEIQRQDIIDEFQEQLSDKDKAIQDSLQTIESILKEKEMFQETIVSLETEREDLEEAIADRDAKVEKLEFDNNSLTQDCVRIEASMEKLRKDHELELEKLKSKLETERGNRKSLENEHDSITSSLMQKVQSLENVNEQNKTLILELEKEKETVLDSKRVLAAKVEEIEGTLRLKDIEHSEKNQDHITIAKQLNEEKEALENLLIASESEKAGLIVSLAEKSLALDRCLSEFKLMQVAHQQHVEELEQSYATISNELQDSLKSVSIKDTEVESLKSEVAMLFSQQQTLIIALAETTSEHNLLSSHNCQLENIVFEQNTNLQDLNNNMMSLRKEKNELMATIEQKEGESRRSMEENAKEIHRLQESVASIQRDFDNLVVVSVINSLSAKNEKIESSNKVSSLEDQIEKQHLSNVTAQNLVRDLEEKCVELETTNNMLKASMEENESELKNLALEKNSLVSELESSRIEVETILDETQQMRDQMKFVTDAVFMLRSDCLHTEGEGMEMSTLHIIESVSKRFHAIEKSNKELEEESRLISIQLDEKNEELNGMNEYVDDLREKNLHLTNQLQLAEAVASGLSFKENQYDDELNQLREKAIQKEDEMKYLESQIAVLTDRNDQFSNEASILNAEYKKLSENFQLAEALSLHMSTIEDERVSSLSHSIETLKEEKEMLLSELEEIKTKLSNGQDNLHSQLTQELSKNSQLKSSLEQVLEQRNSVEASLNEALKTIESLKQETLELQSRLEESQMNYSVEKQKSMDALSEIQSLRKIVDSSDKGSTESESQFKEQIAELQQLLSAANAREEESNRIAIAADQELQLKEKELEEVSLFASECESTIKKMEEINRQLQSQRSLVNSSDNNEVNEIVKDMEILMEEKMEVEQKMNDMKISFQTREDELVNDFEKERTQLLHDAQEKIESLQRCLEETKSELLKHKEDATVTRRELVSLEEQLRSDQTAAIDSDEKLLHLSEQLSASEATISRVQQDLSALQDEYDTFKAHVASTKDAVKQSYEEKLCSLREEISLLKDEVHNQSLKAKSAEERLHYFEHETTRLLNELKSTKQTLIGEKEFAVSKLKEEIALGKVQVSRAEAQMFEMTEKLEEYRNQIESLKKSSDSHDMNNVQNLLQEKQEEIINQSKVITKLQSEVDGLKETIDKLNFKIESKDERIDSLKKKALTKEHVNMIKTLKTERAEYKNKVEKYRLELDMLKSNGINISRPSEELDDLQAKQMALEEKLRKYVAHCDFQKKEKDAIADLVKSTFDDDDSLAAKVDDDLGAAITSLCERLKSLEDELECLMGLKQELSRSEMKLKLAEESRLILQTSLNDMQEKVDQTSEEKEELAKQLKIVTEEVQKLKDKQEKLQQISASVQGSASELEAEKNRQVSYLEKENLQFLSEVKQLKQELRKLKSERRMLSSAVAADDEPTEDLGFLSKLVSNDKENNPNHSTIAENSSVVKPRYGLGAGEGDTNEENTQECQTS